MVEQPSIETDEEELNHHHLLMLLVLVDMLSLLE